MQRCSPSSVLTERLRRLGAQDPAQLVDFTGCCLPKPFSKGHMKAGIPAGKWLRGWPADVRLPPFCCAEIINGDLKKPKKINSTRCSSINIRSSLSGGKNKH